KAEQVMSGRLVARWLDARELPWTARPADPDAAERSVRTAVATAVERRSPYVLLVEKGTFGAASAAPGAADAAPDRTLPSREEALVALTTAIGCDAVIVSTTVMLSRELFDHRARTGSDWCRA